MTMAATAGVPAAAGASSSNTPSKRTGGRDEDKGRDGSAATATTAADNDGIRPEGDGQAARQHALQGEQQQHRKAAGWGGAAVTLGGTQFSTG